jgi:hypothetical protein
MGLDRFSQKTAVSVPKSSWSRRYHAPMASEMGHALRVGELTTEHLGRRIRVDGKDGGEALAGRLQSVLHRSGHPESGGDGTPVTTLVVAWYHALPFEAVLCSSESVTVLADAG